MKKTAFLFFVLSCAFLLLGNARSAEVPLRMKIAKPGEWVAYSMSREIGRKFTVVRFEDREDGRWVVLLSNTTIGGMAVDEGKESEHKVGESNPFLKKYKDADLTIATENIVVKGEEYEATVVSGVSDGMSFSMYVSDKIPVFGMLRFDLMGEPFIKLDSFGYAE